MIHARCLNLVIHTITKEDESSPFLLYPALLFYYCSIQCKFLINETNQRTIIQHSIIK
nr:MAG TPA: PLATZ transcription factor [Caudoviricetes sp.]